MQAPIPPAESYGRGCCAGMIFLFFIPMFLGMLYSFGAFRKRRTGRDDTDDRPQGA